MEPRDNDDDEMELINAEFESMVADLNLDQSAPTTYLDELDAIAKSENAEIYNPPIVRRGIHGSIAHILSSIQRWWNRKNNGNIDGDGAIV